MKRRTRIWALFLARHTSAVAQLRFLIPFSYLPADEFKVVYAPSLKAIFGLLQMPRVIVFHRDSYPFREVSRIIRFARSEGIVTIFDMDDLLIQIPPQHPAYVRFLKLRPHIIELLKAVDIVTVTNNRLKQYYTPYNPEVHVLPNFLDERIWKNKEPDVKKNDKVVIGYAGLPMHAYDFRTVIPAIKHILSEYRGSVCFRFIGCMPDEIKGLRGVEYIDELISYSQYAEALMNAKFDFVIAPLEDNVFNHCKSNIKFLEYSICGYPGIYSSVGPYVDSVVHNKTGLLVKNDISEWISAMDLLINNPQLRSSLARNAFLSARSDYSSAEKPKEWYRLYNRISESFGTGKNIRRPFAVRLISYLCFIGYIQALNIYYKVKNIK